MFRDTNNNNNNNNNSEFNPDDNSEAAIVEWINKKLLQPSEKYRSQINLLAAVQDTDPILRIDANELGGGAFYQMLKHKPEETIKYTTRAVRDYFGDLHPLGHKEFAESIRVELRGYQPQYELSKEDVSKYVHIEGKITALEHKQTVKTKYKWLCSNCHVGDESTSHPFKCPGCGHKLLEFFYDAENLEDQRYVQVTILPDQSYGLGISDMPNTSAQPSMYMIDLRGHLARRQELTYGMNVSIHGIVKVGDPVRVKDFIKDVPAMYIYVQANCIDLVEDSRMKLASSQSAEAVELSETDQHAFRNFKGDNMSDRDLVKILTKSFAPAIVGKEIEPIKESMLYQMVAGYNALPSDSTVLNTDYDKARKFINILLIGNPSTGKTSLLWAEIKLAGGVYATGEGLTPAGTGAGISNDTNVGKGVIAAGIGVAGNNKIKALDELDKMRNANREPVLNQLNTMMESGFYVLSGIVKATLPAQGPWSLGMNPKGSEEHKGEYDPALTFLENVNLPTYIISRTDMVWLMHSIIQDNNIGEGEEEPNYIQDSNDELKLENADCLLLGIPITKDAEDETISLVTKEFLAKWIRYARTIELTNVNREVLKPLHEFYMQMKKSAEERGIKMQMRQYYSMVRVAFGRARFCHRDTLLKEDTDRTIELFKEQWKRIGVNVDSSKPHGNLDLFDEYRHSSQGKTFIGIINTLAKISLDGNFRKSDLITSMVTSQKWHSKEDANTFFENIRRRNAFLEVDTKEEVYKLVVDLNRLGYM